MKILYLVTDDWYFLSHRLDLAREVRDAGCEVVVCTRAAEGGRRLVEEGFRHRHVSFRRSVAGQVGNLPLFATLARLYREELPDLVHHVSFLPIVFGTFAARRAGISAVVNAVTGLGHAFTDGVHGPLRWAVERAYGTALGHPESLTVFQNEDDRRRLGDRCRRHAIIAGSGVDLERFRLRGEPEGTPVVLHASRMLGSKGVEDSLEASRILLRRGIEHRLVLAGRMHPDNPLSIPEATLRRWSETEHVEWVGHVDDVPELLAASTVLSFPTRYREGVPKILLEAAATGRPIVTTDTPGCRDVVRHGENGLLVPVRSPERLADALGELLTDREKRRSFGARGREVVEKRFSKRIVVAQTLAAYQDLLDRPAPWTEDAEEPGRILAT